MSGARDDSPCQQEDQSRGPAQKLAGILLVESGWHGLDGSEILLFKMPLSLRAEVSGSDAGCRRLLRKENMCLR